MGQKTPQAISGCFKHAGFKSTSDEKMVEVESLLVLEKPGHWEMLTEKMGTAISFNNFVEVYGCMGVCGQMTDANIINVVTHKDANSSEREDDDGDTDIAQPLIQL
ncbi:hypothetical protein PR048_015915 [Dryococelus australis]|uniref:Uncharacterized protein n=1 Tax=Dryococelus australis TaxID=614101 RepID=A0ABQ9HIB0_9NEOP|nr:hypothetical protein PR048_015915 [Dryococelus australis]